MNNQNEQLSVLDIITVISLVLQIMGYEQDRQQVSNDVLLKELQRQDREYLDTIIDNQNKILDLLQDR